MPTEQIPIQASEMRGAEQLGGASPRSVNCMVDDAGVVRSRPGIATWDAFPTTIPYVSPVIGMCAFGAFLVYVTEDRYIHAVSEAGGYQALSTSTATTQLDGIGPPSMVAMRSEIIMVGGGLPQTWDGSGAVSSRLGGSPPRLSHIVGIATRAVGSVEGTSGTMQWSGLGDTNLDVWDALNYTEAEAKPDVLVNIVDTTNEIFALGAKTLQVFSPDPVSGFAPGRTVNAGLLAESSVVRMGDSLAFLADVDARRRFIVTDGRAFNEIGAQLAGELQRMATISDCYGMRLIVGPWDGAVWFLPTVGRGFIYAQDKSRWSEWRGWSGTDWQAANITSAVQWPEEGLSLVGLETGQIAQLDDQATDDIGDAIENEIITGFVDHGSSEIKHNACARLTMKGGGTLALSWRDGVDLPFCSPMRLTMTGTRELNSLGPYRKRQWKLRWTAAEDAAVVSMEEDFSFSMRKAA